jgi:catechol 2,3-dioxygenase-like lactoylglutathione lyase family enzyme
MNPSDKKELLPIVLDAVVLECKDAAALSDFYIRLLGWKMNYTEENAWADIVSPVGGVKIAFQQNEDYTPPVWPDEPGAQQQMAHLDFAVRDQKQLDLAAEHAISCGATKAAEQYGGDKWITLIDPAGHPFCFVLW